MTTKIKQATSVLRWVLRSGPTFLIALAMAIPGVVSAVAPVLPTTWASSVVGAGVVVVSWLTIAARVLRRIQTAADRSPGVDPLSTGQGAPTPRR